ncbi:MAG: hypothetical protein OXR67_17265 [Chloroflexota bacterium]|nr:hypothetical protein [Chloroflexota bacterium]
MEREFFQDDTINVRLVREVIQNALDAALDKYEGRLRGSYGPVRVRFSLAGITNPLPAERAQEYIVGLKPHLEAVNDLDNDIALRLKEDSLLASGMPFLVIEDDRTKGLNGDWEQFDDTQEQPAIGNDFYWFFRNVGRSGKGESDNGSWGLGKWVFPDASKISSYIAVTRRSGDGETLLMGQAVLNKHTVVDQRYPPYGYFAEHDTEDFPRPLTTANTEHRPFIRRCIDDFDLRHRSSSGLSVVIPFPRVGGGESEVVLDKNRLLAAVVHNYFFPIVAGHLEVSVEGDGSPVYLSSSNTDYVLDDLPLADTGESSASGYRKLFKMCRDITGLRPDEVVEIGSPGPIQEGSKSHEDLVALRPRYDSEELLAFRISTDVQRRNGFRESSYYSLYLQKDTSLEEGHDYYVRGTLSIPNRDSIRGYSARALLVVNENERLAAMLRDSERPSHNAWYPQDDRVTKRWVATRNRITNVINAPSRLLRILEAAPEGLQRDALTDIFSWDGNWGKPTVPVSVPNVIQEPSSIPIVTPTPPKDLPESRATDFTTTRVGTGFRVRGARSEDSREPFRARLLVAYVVPRGNSFKHYRELDFSLHGPNSLEVTANGGSISPGSSGNELFLDVEDPANFSLTVQGFDGFRDVRVDVKRLAAESIGKEE